MGSLPASCRHKLKGRVSKMKMMEKMLNMVRFVSWISIVSSLLGAVVMFYVGAGKTILAVKHVVLGKDPAGDSLTAMTKGDFATVYVLKSLDSFLIGFVLLIFAYGIFCLFMREEKESSIPGYDWIRVLSIRQLKAILAEAMIIILFVKFLEIVLTHVAALNWEILILPFSILLLSIALRLVDLAGEEDTMGKKEPNVR